MRFSPTELREMADSLLDVARRIGPEGEGMEVDEDFSIEELVQLRSFLSATRQSIDLVNSGLAKYWQKTFPGQEFDDETKIWYVGHTKVKTVVDPDLFIGWVATLDAEQLEKLVNPTRLAKIVKVTGMSPAERDTHISEEYSQTSGISINNKDKK